MVDYDQATSPVPSERLLSQRTMTVAAETTSNENGDSIIDLTTYSVGYFLNS